MDLNKLKVAIFADGADINSIIALRQNPLIKGFTTNPTLMKKAGVQDYEVFARAVLEAVPDLPFSFEVFADDLDAMEQQALEISSWGSQVVVKIPITNTSGKNCSSLIRRLAEADVRMNVTALTTLDQVDRTVKDLVDAPPSYVSVFAGRIADTGRDPVPIMAEAVSIMAAQPNLKLIWASPRELLNIFQADEIGCHVITITNDLLKKLSLVGKNLEEYSLETVRMFYDDARAAGYTLATCKALPA
ncbi:MAG: transaldolase [Terracidiphilus sp.]